MKFVFLVTITISFLFALIDINTADIKELKTLKGIGKSRAEAILRYRDIHCFDSVEELIKVKGIGKKLLEKNKDNLTVGKCKK